MKKIADMCEPRRKQQQFLPQPISYQYVPQYQCQMLSPVPSNEIQTNIVSPMYSTENWSDSKATVVDSGTKIKQTDKKVLPPEIIDNINECATYVLYHKTEVATNTCWNDEGGLAGVSGSEKMYNKQETVANVYVHTAVQYGNIIQIDVEYLENQQQRKRVKALLSYEDYTRGKVVSAFKEKGILCFNPGMGDKKLNAYMTELLRTKLREEPVPPLLPGFGKWKGKNAFASAEFYEHEGLPKFVSKHFDMYSDDSFSEAMEKIIKSADSYNDRGMFLTLNLIRIAGMLTTPLADAGFIYPKIVFVKGTPQKLAEFFQVYERGYTIQKPCKINVSPKEFEAYLTNLKDDVLMLTDDEHETEYKKDQGRANLFRLDEMMDENQRQEKLKYPFLPVIFSERLMQEIPAEKVFFIDASFLKTDKFSDKEIINRMYNLDRKIVQYVCSEMPDFLYNLKQKFAFETFVEVRESELQYEESRKLLRILILLLKCILCNIPFNFRSEYNMKKVTESMIWYLKELMLMSEKYCSGGSMAKEFEIVLNRMITEGRIELLLHSELSKGINSSQTVLSAFLGENYLYFINDAFDIVTNEMLLSPNSCAVRKALKKGNLLKFGNDLQVQVTLYDRHYSGRQLVTAVKRSVLSEESLKKLKGGIFNFEPCFDEDNIRIPVGIDEQGRMVYLSPEHPDLKNKHIQIMGDSGSGKSVAGNLIVRSKYDHGENIIYVDYSNSNSETKMLSHGFDKEFYDTHVRRFEIENCMEEDGLQLILHEMQENHTILVFHSRRHDENVEQFLKLLYELIAADDNLTVTLVIDEVHELSYKRGSGLVHIIEEGRGNGISLISILQAPHELKPKQMSMLNESAVKLIFSFSDNDDAHICAEKNRLKPMYKFSELLGDMPKQHCLVVGSLEDSSGEIQTNRFIKVRIPDLDEKV